MPKLGQGNNIKKKMFEPNFPTFKAKIATLLPQLMFTVLPVTHILTFLPKLGQGNKNKCLCIAFCLHANDACKLDFVLCK